MVRASQPKFATWIHAETTGKRVAEKGPVWSAILWLRSNGERKVHHAARRDAHRRLSAACQLLYTLGDIVVETLQRDSPALLIVCLSAQALDDCLGKCAIAPRPVLEGELTASRCRENDDAVLCGGQVAHKGIDAVIEAARLGRTERISRVAGIDEEDRLPSKAAQRVMDV